MFEKFGIEAEYMIVHKETLQVLPVAHLFFEKMHKQTNSASIDEINMGRVSLSNELANHVIELKCTVPEKSLVGLDEVFHETVLKVNEELEEYDGVLMPTAMHPYMIPEKETMLWPYGQKEIYQAYDKIFGCKGHGWANLQSVHINLPFEDEEEFVCLYNAIRLILPLVPFLSASSPFYEGREGETLNSRIAFYRNNQKRIPSVTGEVIPEELTSFDDYENLLKRIYADLAVLDPEGVLQYPWINSRGAIAKMDVKAIEIRLMDIQESPLADFVLIDFFVAVLKFLTRKKQVLSYSQKSLVEIFNSSLKSKDFHLPKDYTDVFDLEESSMNDFIENLFEKKAQEFMSSEKYKGLMRDKIKSPSLGQKMKEDRLSNDLLKKLIDCLRENRLFHGK